MECREVIDRLWEYLDDELAAEEAAAVRHHLAGCRTCPPRCRCDRTFLLVIVRALTAPRPAPAGLSESVRAILAAQVRAR
jgi:mycothiol system anti-sigma-R factor